MRPEQLVPTLPPQLVRLLGIVFGAHRRVEFADGAPIVGQLKLRLCAHPVHPPGAVQAGACTASPSADALAATVSSTRRARSRACSSPTASASSSQHDHPAADPGQQPASGPVPGGLIEVGIHPPGSGPGGGQPALVAGGTEHLHEEHRRSGGPPAQARDDLGRDTGPDRPEPALRLRSAVASSQLPVCSAAVGDAPGRGYPARPVASSPCGGRGDGSASGAWTCWAD